jgi:hypothetical protein
MEDEVALFMDVSNPLLRGHLGMEGDEKQSRSALDLLDNVSV